MHTTALKRVDLPTLGRPTMPALKLMLILAAEKRRLKRSIECGGLERFGHWKRRGSLRATDADADDMEGIK